MTDTIFPGSTRGPPPDPADFSRAPERPLFELFGRLGLETATTRHAPVFTVAESQGVKDDLPGGHSKNLFMRDKKGALVLVSAWQNSVLPLNRLHRALGCQRLSFTDPDLLWEALGVTPGSVTAFALVNDREKRVRFVLDQALAAFGAMNFHPLRCDMTTSISVKDFMAFAAATGHAPELVDFTRLAEAD